VPLIVLAEATSLQGAIANFDVTAIPTFGGSVYINCSHRSGEQFPFDSTTVDCTAMDDFGGGDKASFSVQVADTTPPSISIPRDMTLFGTKEGTVVWYDAKASDVVDPEATVNCSPASGTLFPVGTTTVNCTSFDRFKNQGTASFRVHTGTEETPALVVPVSFTAEAQSSEGSLVDFSVSATDVKGGAVPVECSAKPGQLFPLGTTDVKCTATGSSGLTETEIFSITVADKTAPQLSLPRGVSVQATSTDGEKVIYDAGAKDAVDGATEVLCFPASGSLFAPGDTMVTCTTSDKSRNESTASFVVTVVPLFDDTVYSRYGNPTDEK